MALETLTIRVLLTMRVEMARRTTSILTSPITVMGIVMVGCQRRDRMQQNRLGQPGQLNQLNRQKTHPSTSSGGGGCKGTSLLGLCVANVGLFAQGVGEVLAAAEVLIAALIGAFQSSGLLWLIGQAFQYVASDAILLMRNG